MIRDDNSELSVFARRLKELRERNGLSQKEFGQKIGVNTASVSNYEVDRNTPKLETLAIIGRTFNCSIDWLLGLEEKDKISEKGKEEDKKTTYADIMNQLFQLETIINAKKETLALETELDTRRNHKCKKPFEIIEVSRRDRFRIEMSLEEYENMIHPFVWNVPHTKKIPIEGDYDDTNTLYDPMKKVCDIEHKNIGYVIYINDYMLQKEIQSWSDMIEIRDLNTSGRNIYEDWKSGSLERLSKGDYDSEEKLVAYPIVTNSGSIRRFKLGIIKDGEDQEGVSVLKKRTSKEE